MVFEMIDPNMPPGTPGPKQATVVMECPSCLDQWDVLGTDELGDWQPQDEDDLLCPSCEKRGELC